MDRKALRNYAVKVLGLKDRTQKDKITFFNKLFDNHLLDQNRLLKACLNHSYRKKLREDNTRKSSDIVLDIALEFEISTKTVYNCIYKYPHVVLEL